MSGLLGGHSGPEGAVRATIARCIDQLLGSVDLSQADLILVLPPFASPDRPSLGLHALSAAVEAAGFRCRVVYANLAYAALIGLSGYRALCHMPTGDLVGECLFRRARYGEAATRDDSQPPSWERIETTAGWRFTDLQLVSELFVEAFAAALSRIPVRFIGLSTVFEQTLSSLSLIRAIKQQAPEKITLLGGANVDGEMGVAVAVLEPAIDHVFTGEADRSLPQFLKAYPSDPSGHPGAAPRIIAGNIIEDLDSLPVPSFEDFFSQLAAVLADAHRLAPDDPASLRIPYESSRGCWWGAKHHCTFCGLNANGMTHRAKSADKVFEEIQALSAIHDIDQILMVDNIMPHQYFSTLLPRLRDAERHLNLFYEQKANLSREKMALLAASGVRSIQPGIESLSTSLLKRMRKGSSAQTNIDCMRFARAAGVAIVWNLLCDFPGDAAADYEEMIAVIPLLHHLQPPGGIGGLSIDRFSPYHQTPGQFGIASIRPLDAYQSVFPGRDLHRLSYHFVGDYHSAIRADPTLSERLRAVVDPWEAAWSDGTGPILSLFEVDDGRRLVVDTRTCSQCDVRMVGFEEAGVLLRGARSEAEPHVGRLLDLGQLARVDGRPCAIAFAQLDADSWLEPQVQALPATELEAVT